jgi:hypothetical protein
MPILPPTEPTQFYISDLAAEVIKKCENRQASLGRAYQWLVDALLEISGNPSYRDDFVDLAEWGPQYNLTGLPNPIQEYDQTLLVPSGDVLLNTLDILIWPDYPPGNSRFKLNLSTFQKTDRFQPATSLPVEWYRFGNTIGFNPIPDKSYQVQARILRRHPINDSSLKDTLVLIPREWNELLTWAAVMRGFMESGEYEKASNVRTMIYGDPEDAGKPGIVKSVKRPQEKENWRSEHRLRFTRRSAMYGRR